MASVSTYGPYRGRRHDCQGDGCPHSRAPAQDHRQYSQQCTGWHCNSTHHCLQLAPQQHSPSSRHPLVALHSSSFCRLKTLPALPCNMRILL